MEYGRIEPLSGVSGKEETAVTLKSIKELLDEELARTGDRAAVQEVIKQQAATAERKQAPAVAPQPAPKPAQPQAQKPSASHVLPLQTPPHMRAPAKPVAPARPVTTARPDTPATKLQSAVPLAPAQDTAPSPKSGSLLKRLLGR
ncbi:hypothetical protein EU803_00160 [Loktanella sp. IMCC34160]|uniref:hypothetical protein n=1 Tax=Loktanella sp. IMCC34160 TaxID=2510646 RepID=UPI00101CD434|nr:hypothetical protein [Loktanella sp. IMCC34160]RYG92556.1 hypothetical protein EU803_00160 [Loktanella sp. IMCC34160]